DKGFSLGDNRDGLVVLLFHDAGEAASILQVDGRGAIFVRDDCVGVENILQNVLEVAAIGPGQVRTHFSARVKERVTLLTDAGEHGPTARSIARLRPARPINALKAFDFLLFVRAAFANGTVNLLQVGVDLRVFQIPQLANDFRGEGIARNPAV